MTTTNQQRAQAELDRIDSQIDEWRQQLAVKRRELDAAHAGVGQAVLSGTTTTTTIAQRLAALRDELMTIE